MVLVNKRIAVIGLGYVGLPLAVEFGRFYKVIGYDIDISRIEQLREGIDVTKEINIELLNSVLTTNLVITCDKNELADCNIFIITVPTPVDEYKKPDLKFLINATEIVGRLLKHGDIVIFESTVYPGCTEEVCVPILEICSNLKYNIDFFVGYSPERINPGDKKHTLTNTIKVTSGSTPEAGLFIDELYNTIIHAGTYLTTSIRVAEASKAIENAQRDINISFINELSLIFDRIGVDTIEVLEAAGTKYNFMKFRPGLVGGHCISVDPYYLAHKAIQMGYEPEVILSGRRINDRMAGFIAAKTIKLIIGKGKEISKANILILGITFKENCPDIRNSKVIDIYRYLVDLDIKVTVYDPLAEKREVLSSYEISLSDEVADLTIFDAIIIAVAHDEFKLYDYEKYKKGNGIIFDVKSLIDKEFVDCRL